jgi:4-hydroxy-3-methylbut-2-enyl diphosphate reductase IspH
MLKFNDNLSYSTWTFIHKKDITDIFNIFNSVFDVIPFERFQEFCYKFSTKNKYVLYYR